MFTGTDMGNKLYGKYPGIVVDNQPQEGGGKFQGDIKVKVSSILDEDRQPIEVRAQPCFHPGFFFVPEVGDNVWVEFVAGDIDFPIWSGVWYPQRKTPKTSDNQAPVTEKKVIRTASGHVMELDDDGGKIVILDKNNNRVTLDDQGITITDKSNNEVVMKSSGVTIKSNAIKLGSDAATEPLVLGNKWMTRFNTHVHIGNLGGPTSPPGAAGTLATLAQLSAKHKTE